MFANNYFFFLKMILTVALDRFVCRGVHDKETGRETRIYVGVGLGRPPMADIHHNVEPVS